MPKVAALVCDLYELVDQNRRDLSKVSQDVIQRIERLKKTFDSIAKQYEDAEKRINLVEGLLEIPPFAQVFIGLDFKKYEEIINYIQTWSSLLKEPERPMPDSKYRLEMQILDIEKDQLNYESQPDKMEDTKYLGFCPEASQKHVFDHCQKIIDSAKDEIKEKVGTFIDYIIRNRLGRLELELQSYITVCETLEQAHKTPKETVLSEKEYLDSRAPWENKCRVIKDRIRELETEKQNKKLSV